MRKNTKWLIAISVATMLTANGLVMAATTTQQQETKQGKPAAFAKKGCAKERGMKGFGQDHAALLELLKIDKETLRAERKAGKTLAAVAGERGVSEQTLKEFIIGQMTKRMDEGVKAGKISAEKAETMKTNMDQRVTDMINSQGPQHKKHGPGAMHKRADHTKLLELLKIDADTLKSERSAGKSLAAIAGERGVSEQALKNFMAEQMTQRIEEGVKAGRISAEKADTMKAGMDQRISDMINRQGHGRNHQPPKQGV